MPPRARTLVFTHAVKASLSVRSWVVVIRSCRFCTWSNGMPISIGADQMQRNFKPMVEQVNRWQASQLSDTSAKLVIYRAFVEAELDIPHYLDRIVHWNYFL